ncbi:hypothetical protein TSAR_016811 [Trichomalopsis sarcophagae]|uniref:Protein broad-minded n=1 Tax=Trichomalopsis sarcophagae TaxID=543379 RepID=A0A232F1B0_9HYME|nr:hypothetical protein TSAR_016811 [Trichomalopsis sarcophagae]
MESQLSPRFKKFIKKCLNDEFSSSIDENLKGDREPYDVAQKIINSREMTELSHAIRTSFVEQIDASRATTRLNSAATSRPQTSLSFVSDLSAGDDWSLKANGIDEFGQIVEQMGQDQPDHVRLAGYEALLETELANLPTSNSWEALLKTLRDGLTDDSRSVFEASLLVHAKLLNCPQFLGAYSNLLSAYTEQCHSKKLFDTLPNLLSGVNFKIFLHEKLFRMMRLILDEHEELLKTSRAGDKFVEEAIEQFVAFVCSHSIFSTAQLRQLSALNIIALLEPQAGWSRKWLHALHTRKILCAALSKSPSLLHFVVACVKRGLDQQAGPVSVTICDEPADVFVSGDSIEVFTYLHCLHLLTQLCSYSTGRTLLSESQTDESFSIPDFLAGLLSSLNALAASDASNGIYEMVRSALKTLLKRPLILYDARFHRMALSPLERPEQMRLWPHSLDVLGHMLDTQDGPNFLMTEYRINSAASLENSRSPSCPLMTILAYAANMLRQPVAVMSVEHVVQLFRFVGRIFAIHEIFYIVEEMVRENFYPSVTYLYSKLDKYYIENENKTQHLDKAVKEMLLSVVSIPLGLQMLSNEPLVLEELIRGSIAPVRASWSDFNVVSFISNAGFLSRGTEILLDLAPHVLSTLLAEVCKVLEDPQQFHDPWENADVKLFLHVLSLFSLNTSCFMAFMTSANEASQEDSGEYLTNLYELFQHFIDIDSQYHHLGLLSLKVIIWNLDIYVYLINLLDFQNEMLKFQEYGSYEHAEPLDVKSNYIVDECSLLRHTILLNCYYVRHKRSEYMVTPEESRLFSKLPPPEGIDDDFVKPRPSQSDLTTWLQDTGPGLRDHNWVLQTRRAHRSSPAPMQNAVLINLLDQMEQAVEQVEWVDRFKWDPDLKCSDDYWLPEELHGIDLVVHYGVINGQLERTGDSKHNLKVFIQSSHDFINYNKSLQFEGFDWFLSTIFLICSGNVEKAKTFVTQILRFPSAIFMWPALAQAVDESNQEEASTRFLFAHLLENIVSQEFPTIKFALKNECGIDWWMICDRLLTQCFWGILPWSEIMHYLAICITHPPDYVVYYCASLLNHCEGEMLKNIMKGKSWPEDMILEDYRIHSQMGFMDRLGKRHGGKVLPPLTQRKLNIQDNEGNS